ncbi:proteasome endopeptidase complex [Ranunculus cassubicifolius]
MFIHETLVQSSPCGRIFWRCVKYLHLITKNHVLLMEPSSVEKIMEIDDHIGCAMSGLIADARTLVEHARVETQNHRFSYGEPMTVESTTQALCDLALRFGEGDEESMNNATSLHNGICTETADSLHAEITLQEAETIALSILKQVMEEKLPVTVFCLFDIASAAGLWHNSFFLHHPP